MVNLQPIAIGVSVASLGVIGFYILYRKKFSGKRKVFKLEIKIPNAYVGYVIGRCGGTIKNIQAKCATKIKFVPPEYTDNCTLCIIKGERDKVELTEDVIRKIIKTYEDDNIDSTKFDYATKIKFLNEKRKSSPDPDATIFSDILEQMLSQDALDSDEDEYVSDGSSSTDSYGNVTGLESTDIDCSSVPRGLESRIVENISNFKNHTQKLYSVGGDGYIPIYVSAVANPMQFWVQAIKTKEHAELDRMTQELLDFYHSNPQYDVPPEFDSIKIGDIYATFFEEDNRWYRAEVANIGKKIEDNVTNSILDMYILDYGESTYQKLKHVRYLPVEFLQLNFQAVECSLSSIKAKQHPWPEEATVHFEDMTHSAQWYTLKARIDYYIDNMYESENIPCLKILDTNSEEVIDINDEMVKSGYAEYVPV